MTYKYTSATYFTNTKDLTTYTCYAQSTRYGFRHIAFKGIVENPYSKKPDAKRCYYNRTWEHWRFESVLSDLTNPDELRQVRLENI